MEEQAQSRSRASEVVGQLDELEPLKNLPDEEVP